MTQADFATHRIEGFARVAEERGIDGSFSVPLISHVVGNLWQGGCRDGTPLPEDFKYVVSLYPWERYRLGPNTERTEARLYDSHQMPDTAQLVKLAREVNRMRADGKTLVHCQAGLNRSGLIAGLALVLDGMEPRDAIALLRQKRCDMVLCNDTFERWLLAFKVRR